MLNENAYLSIREEAESAGATLVAVTKQRPISVIQSLYDLGQRDFGENRVTELTQKQADLPDDIRWHFIGHLQRNKVKYIAPFIHLIHSGDSPRLLRAINAEAVKVARTIPVLLQYRIANEESKYGLDPEAPTAIFEGLGLRDVANIRIDGVMGMATYTDDEEQVSNEFGRLAAIFSATQTARVRRPTDIPRDQHGYVGRL